MGVDERILFEYSPISLWEEDFSEVKRGLDALRAQGVVDLAAYLDEQPGMVDEYEKRIRVLDVNRKTLELFAARSKAELLNNLDKIFRDEMRARFRAELLDVWAGKLVHESEGINYSLNGKPVNVRVHWAVLPGYEEDYRRVLVALEDITERKAAEDELKTSEAHFRDLFENFPVSLWEEDFSGVREVLDDLRAQGVDDLEAYLHEHPDVVDECEKRIRVLDVNRRTLELFGACSKAELLDNLHKVFRDEMRNHFREELNDMWVGRLVYEREGVNYSLLGNPIDLLIHWSVMPGYETSFERILVALEDITARKKAENYLKYLGTHDILTRLYNRAYFEEEMARLKRSRRYPISIVMCDLNGLKQVNDTLGHDSGDGLIRRAGEILMASFRVEDVVARIGGDEFAMILPETDEEAAGKALERIRQLVVVNNKFYQGPPLSISLGTATCHENGDLMDAFRQADDLMYQEKAKYKKALRNHVQE